MSTPPRLAFVSLFCVAGVGVGVGACGTSPPPPAATPIMADPVKAATAPPETIAPPVAVAAPPVAPPPPSGPRAAEAILADAVKGIGGEAALNAHTTMRMKLEVTFKGMGISGSIERLATSSGKMLVTTDVPGNGTSREGTNGTAFWADDPINGLRAVSGAEAELLRIDASFCPELHATELFKTIASKSDVGPSGAPLECVVLTPRAGSAITNCYDPRTHLQVLQKGTHTTPQGDSPFTTVIKDYRDVGGVQIPFSLDTQEGPFTFTMRVTDVKLDTPLDDKLFDMPRTDGGKGQGKQDKPAKAGKKPSTKPSMTHP
jgi:hypothetical protein